MGSIWNAMAFMRYSKKQARPPRPPECHPTAFAEAFKEARDSGDEVIAITLSSALSGTYQSAKLAQAMVGEEGVYVVDSLTATYAIAMIAEYACALRDEGLSAKQIVAEIERFKGRVKLVAVLDTLEYLQRGGRLPKAAARLGEAAQAEARCGNQRRGRGGP